jgi:hypothetical protein
MFWFIDLGMIGFPDGYITPYARATSVPLHLLAWGCVAQSVYFLIKGAVGRHMTTVSLGVQISAAAVFIVAPVLVMHNCPRSQACNDAYLAITGEMLDDGTGG